MVFTGTIVEGSLYEETYYPASCIIIAHIPMERALKYLSKLEKSYKTLGKRQHVVIWRPISI